MLDALGIAHRALVEALLVERRYPDGAVETYGPGEAFAIRKGTPLVWHQDGPVRKFFVIRES